MFWRGPLPPTYNGASPLRVRTAPKLSIVVGRPPSMDRFTIWSKVTSSTVWNWPSLMVSVLQERADKNEGKPTATVETSVGKPKGGRVPVDGMSWLAARVIADLHVTLIELHCDMIVVSIIKKDAVVLCCRHLHRVFV